MILLMGIIMFRELSTMFVGKLISRGGSIGIIFVTRRAFCVFIRLLIRVGLMRVL